MMHAVQIRWSGWLLDYLHYMVEKWKIYGEEIGEKLLFTQANSLRQVVRDWKLNEAGPYQASSVL